MTSELFTCVHSSGYAHISRSSVFSRYSLKLVRLIHCNNVAVRYFNRLSDRELVLCLEAWGQPCWFPGSEKLGPSRNGRMEQNFLVIPILRNFRLTSRGTPKISEWNSGKCLFHSLPNPEFPEFLVEWKAPSVSNSEIFQNWHKFLYFTFSMDHVRYINILTWLRGFQVKLLYLVLFLLYLSLLWELRDKRNLKNLQFWPENLGAMLEYWYIERGLFWNNGRRGKGGL